MIPLSLTLAILLILIGRLLVVFDARFAWNDPGLRRIVRGLVGIAVVCVIISILPLLWFVPSWLLNSDPNVKYLKPKEYFDTANGIRTAFVSAIGIPLGIGALYFTWQQLATARHQTLDQLELARNAQIADRFTKAVDQLGSEALDVRIYSGPLCQDTGEGQFKVETSPFSRRLAGLCKSLMGAGVTVGAK